MSKLPLIFPGDPGFEDAMNRGEVISGSDVNTAYAAWQSSDGQAALRGRCERSWTEQYYDAMDHYAWAPDRLGHRSDPGHRLKSPTNVVKRLRRIEEPLNHILGIFFSLASPSLVHELFSNFAGLSTFGDLTSLGRDVNKRLTLGSLTQPDLTFSGPRAFLSIECKIEGRSSPEQLLKYAVLHARAEKASPGRAHGLLYLSRCSEGELFSIRFEGWQDLKSRCIELIATLKKGKLANPKPGLKQEMLQGLDLLTIGHCTYADLAVTVERYSRAAAEISDGGVAARLYSGLLDELARRHLR